jgi:uncharacterized protein YprB with RNaseH-like and TPR domain
VYNANSHAGDSRKDDNLREAVFDIESTDLAAVGSGIVLCVGIRSTATNRTKVFRIDQYDYEPSDEFGFLERQEKDLLKDALAELDKYDLLVGHNIDRFDIPFLRSRAYQYGMNWWTHPLTYDTLIGFRRSGLLTRQNGFGKPSASMAMVADFLGVEQLKTSIFPREWWLTVWGNKKKRQEHMNEVVDHNQRDVRLNAAMYPILLANDPKVIIKRLA